MDGSVGYGCSKDMTIFEGAWSMRLVTDILETAGA